MAPVRRIRLRWVLLLAVALFGVAVALLVRDRAVPCGELRLRASEWRSDSPERWKRGETTRRQAIADDVVRCGALVGDTRREVEAQMGRTTGSRAEDVWEFTAGRSRRGDQLVGWRNEVLVVTFGSADRVTLVELRTR